METIDNSIFYKCSRCHKWRPIENYQTKVHSQECYKSCKSCILYGRTWSIKYSQRARQWFPEKKRKKQIIAAVQIYEDWIFDTTASQRRFPQETK